MRCGVRDDDDRPHTRASLGLRDGTSIAGSVSFLPRRNTELRSVQAGSHARQGVTAPTHVLNAVSDVFVVRLREPRYNLVNGLPASRGAAKPTADGACRKLREIWRAGYDPGRLAGKVRTDKRALRSPARRLLSMRTHRKPQFVAKVASFLRRSPPVPSRCSPTWQNREDSFQGCCRAFVRIVQWAAREREGCPPAESAHEQDVLVKVRLLHP